VAVNSLYRFISLLSTVLITAGFTLSGFHYHDERKPDAADDEVSIVHELDFCLLCEGISSENPEASVSAEGFFAESVAVTEEDISAISPHLILIQNSRAPPAQG